MEVVLLTTVATSVVAGIQKSHPSTVGEVQATAAIAVEETDWMLVETELGQLPVTTTESSVAASCSLPAGAGSLGAAESLPVQIVDAVGSPSMLLLVAVDDAASVAAVVAVEAPVASGSAVVLGVVLTEELR